MVLRYVAVFLMLTAPGVGLAQPPSSSLADLHRAHGLTCSACHKESPPQSAAPDKVCVDCHGGVAAIIARTENYDPNPHVSPHSADLQCSTCHHAHEPSEISCLACHADKTFVKRSGPQ